MKDALKFTAVLAAAILVMLLIRAYAFTIYRVTSTDLEPLLRQGSRVMVNKLRGSDFEKGDLVVFRSDSSYIGIIEQLPGDTVMVEKARYVLPNQCGCKDCVCSENNYYLVNQGSGMTIVRETEIVGKAMRLSLWGKSSPVSE